MDEKDAGQLVFRKPSLTHEADAAVAGLTQLATSASTDSLANNTYGTTFAAKARAAELQAARARKLKENNNQTGLHSVTMPHEVMTFTKARTTRGRTWKMLNLHDLPDASIGYTQPDEYRTSPDITTTNRYPATQDSTAEYDLHRGLTTANSNLGSSRKTSGIETGNTSRQAQNLSPDLESLSGSVTGYAASQWDPELPMREQQAEISAGCASPEPRTRTSSASLTLFPLPVLTSSSDRIQKEGEYLRQKQESLLQELQAELQAGLQNHNLSKQVSIAATGHDDTMRSTMSLMSQSHTLEQPQAASNMVKNDKDLLAEPSPPNSPAASIVRQLTDTTYNVHETQSSQYGLPNRRFIPNQYAAVKGTMGHTSHPQQERILRCEPFSQQRYEYPAPIQDSVTLPPTASAHKQQIPYRKLSAEEKKGRLLQQLHAVADESNRTGNVASFGRTVLHDPFASTKYKDSQSELSSTIPTSSERDLVMTSDPLPWKDRPVNVVSASSLNGVEYSYVGTYPSLPSGARPILMDVSCVEQSTYSRGLSVEEAELWWGRDSRIDVITQKHVGQILGRISEEKHFANNAEIARFSATSCRDRFESLKLTTTIIHLPSRAISDNILIPVLSNLATYLQSGGYFNRHGKAPDWCIDQGTGGQLSFFGEDWGVPPPRMGRDPRYQPVIHEGTRSVYSDFTSRHGSHGYTGRFYH